MEKENEADKLAARLETTMDRRIVTNSEGRQFRIQVLFRFEPVISDMACTYCNGHGTVGGYFHSLEDPTQCPHCFGNRQEPLHPPKEYPRDLIEHMRKAFVEWLEKA